MSPTASNDLLPFRMVEHANSTSLILTTFDQGADVFEAYGYDAGGYAWQGVAQTLIQLRAPHLASQVKFDSESSMFTAYGAAPAALVELSHLMREAMTTRAVLENALSQVTPEQMD